jgi:hypothetical protein
MAGNPQTRRGNMGSGTVGNSKDFKQLAVAVLARSKMGPI